MYSTEVENAVAQHPAVANCTVVGVPDEQWGERINAVVVRKPAAELTGQDIREHAKTDRRLQRARTVEFVNALPATPTGKVPKTRAARDLPGRRRPRRELSLWPTSVRARRYSLRDRIAVAAGTSVDHRSRRAGPREHSRH